MFNSTLNFIIRLRYCFRLKNILKFFFKGKNSSWNILRKLINHVGLRSHSYYKSIVEDVLKSFMMIYLYYFIIVINKNCLLKWINAQNNLFETTVSLSFEMKCVIPLRFESDICEEDLHTITTFNRVSTIIWKCNKFQIGLSLKDPVCQIIMLNETWSWIDMTSCTMLTLIRFLFKLTTLVKNSEG